MKKEVVEVIIATARDFEANYPETLKSGFNLNCPKVFAVLFNMIKPFLSERTLSKISIFDSNASKWEPSLKKMVDSSMLPKKYGGHRETSGKCTYFLHFASCKIGITNCMYFPSSTKTMGFAQSPFGTG